jgi:hypothetical protein
MIFITKVVDQGLTNITVTYEISPKKQMIFAKDASLGGQKLCNINI